MSCISIGPPVLPKIPDFLLTAPTLTTPLPVGIDLPCCKFEVTIPGLDLALAVVNTTIAVTFAAAAAPVMVGIMTLNTAIDQIQDQLNDLVLTIPRCPIDGATL